MAGAGGAAERRAAMALGRARPADDRRDRGDGGARRPGFARHASQHDRGSPPDGRDRCPGGAAVSAPDRTRRPVRRLRRPGRGGAGVAADRRAQRGDRLRAARHQPDAPGELACPGRPAGPWRRPGDAGGPPHHPSCVGADVMISRILSFFALLYVLGYAGFAVMLPRPADDRPTDAIVVLTGGANRIERGLDLLQRGRAKRLLVSGVDRTVRPVDLAAHYPGREALFKCCIDLGRESVDTRSNAEEVARWMDKRM